MTQVLRRHADRHHRGELGAEGHINGATPQADILGIFGREGLDMAARWATPAAATPTYKAIKLYRNYDGARSTFGDTSIAATTTNPDVVSAFAAERSGDGAITVMVVNKSTTSAPTTVTLANVAHGDAGEVWQLTAANAITRLADVAARAPTPSRRRCRRRVSRCSSSRAAPRRAPARGADGLRIVVVSPSGSALARPLALRRRSGYAAHVMPVPPSTEGPGLAPRASPGRTTCSAAGSPQPPVPRRRRPGRRQDDAGACSSC